MVEWKTIYTFCVEKKEASIQSKRDDVIITTYTLDGDNVIISRATEDIETTVDEFYDSLNALLKWYELCLNFYKFESLTKNPYKLRYEKEIDSCSARIIIGNKTIINCSWNHTTNKITWKSHPEVICNWSDFKNWLDNLSRIHSEITSF